MRKSNKTILFICYWSINDGLTHSTALPHLSELQSRKDVNKVVFVTIERGERNVKTMHGLTKVEHIPINATTATGFNVFSKLVDFLVIPAKFLRIIKAYQVNLIIAHGAPAGSLAYKISRKLKLPFYVSLFEPHANYMLESGVWYRFGLKYVFQKKWEKQQMKYADGLMPVAQGYSTALKEKGVIPAKIFTVPCSVPSKSFAFDTLKREEIRGTLGWHGNVIGIYVGKYGDMYYQKEAFEIYAKCFKLIPKFRLIILSPQPAELILKLLQENSINLEHVMMASVQHTDVPKYLSAADFAFATYKPNPSKKFLSPVKIGEYWANGLPVLLTDGIGDDSEIIKNEGGGALFNLERAGSVEAAVKDILITIQNTNHREHIAKLATKYRNPNRIREAYDKFFSSLEAEEVPS